jgi:Mn2+/Fe2+ NRAMP family transporter
MNDSRGLRDTAVRALAKVGLVWAIAVLGAVFMVTSAQGQYDDVPTLSSASADAQSAAASVTSGDAPRTAGLALALVLLGGGAIVLAVGATPEERQPVRRYARESEPTTDLPLALGLGLLA